MVELVYRAVLQIVLADILIEIKIPLEELEFLDRGVDRTRLLR